jgi:hypothetical protein
MLMVRSSPTGEYSRPMVVPFYAISIILTGVGLPSLSSTPTTIPSSALNSSDMEVGVKLFYSG